MTDANMIRAASFLESGFNKVSGWLVPQVLLVLDALVNTLNEFNHDWQDSIEIGVHEGKFFIPIELVTPPQNKVIAVDVFGRQDLNIDRSGRGNLEHFTKNVTAYCKAPSRVVVKAIDSFDLTQSDLSNKSFSIASIDGGHTVKHVLNDMSFIHDRLQNGGVLILDDFPNPAWLGVLEGVSSFLSSHNSRLAPFAVGFNKLYFTTTSYRHQIHQKISQIRPESGIAVRRSTEFFGFPIHILEKS